MGVQKLTFNVATGLYTPGGEEIARAVRRAISHPTTVGFVKRAVNNGEVEGEHVELPVWGMVLLGVSFYAAIIAMSLVSTLCFASTPSNPLGVLTDLSLVVLHAQGSRRYALHGRDPTRRYHHLSFRGARHQR